MTEIPEHLLKRAAERRAAMSGGGDAAAAAPAADAAPAASGDAPSAAVAPAAKAKAPAPLPTLDDAPAKVVPDIAVVAAAKNRKRVPYWAAATLALLPLWGFMYLYSVTVPPAGENDPLVIGKEVYAANCQSCHQPDGAGVEGGGTGQKLKDGHTVETFGDPLAMVHWLAFGATNGGDRDDGTYGDLDRPGGPMNVSTLTAQMPAFASTLDAEELAAVTIYVRQEFGGDLYDPETEQGFTVEGFEADPGALEAQVEATVELGETGDPDVATIEGREAE